MSTRSEGRAALKALLDLHRVLVVCALDLLVEDLVARVDKVHVGAFELDTPATHRSMIAIMMTTTTKNIEVRGLGHTTAVERGSCAIQDHSPRSAHG